MIFCEQLLPPCLGVKNRKLTPCFVRRRYYRAAREEWDKVWGMGNPVDEGDDESAAPGQRDNDSDAFTESPASAQAER